MREPYRLKDLTGYSLNVRDGEIGELEEIYFDDEGWLARYFVVRTGSWLLGRRVLIVPAVINGIDDEAKSFDVELTRQQVENCPPIDTRLPVSRHYEQEYYRYYGWEPYWSGLGPAPYMLPTAEGEPEKPEHPHLQSSNEVKSYSVHAQDGDIGHVEDIILEHPGWAIRYLQVDTRNWLPGKRVLVAPSWVRQVDWSKQRVVVDLSREAIETAPPYDPSKVISRDYQLRLYEHYGKKVFEAD